jgi:anti-anti-sigma factor
MKQLFSCTVDFGPGCAIAYLGGELDAQTAECLTAVVSPLANASCDIVVNLSGLGFLGTAGVVALTDLQRDATAAGGSLRLTELPALAWRALAVTGMRDGFSIASHTYP